MAKFQPTFDNLLVEILEPSSSSSSASPLRVSQGDDKRTEEGKVIAIGPGHFEDGKLVPMGVKVGDIVVFPTYAKTIVLIDGLMRAVVPEKEVVGTIK